MAALATECTEEQLFLLLLLLRKPSTSAYDVLQDAQGTIWELVEAVNRGDVATPSTFGVAIPQRENLMEDAIKSQVACRTRARASTSMSRATCRN